jgi:hypothetical protein
MEDTERSVDRQTKRMEKIVRIGDPRKINETSRGDDTLRCGTEQNIPQRRSFDWQISDK